MSSVYKVTTRGQIEGQDCLNIYGYVGAGIDARADLLGEVFDQVILEVIRLALSASFTYLEMLIEDLFQSAENTVIDVSDKVGTRDAQHISAFYTYSFQLQSAISGYRSGRKALSGVADIDVSSGVPTGAQQTRLDAVADVLGTAYSIDGLDATYYPCVLSKNANGNTFAVPIAFTQFKRLSTQNSRKLYTSASAGLGLSNSGKVYVPVGSPTITLSSESGGKMIEDYVAFAGGLNPISIPATNLPLPIPLP